MHLNTTAGDYSRGGAIIVAGDIRTAITINRTATTSNCTFEDCSSNEPGGGAIYMRNGLAKLIGCRFVPPANASAGHNDVCTANDQYGNTASAVFVFPTGRAPAPPPHSVPGQCCWRRSCRRPKKWCTAFPVRTR
jgi:hypothetical protein